MCTIGYEFTNQILFKNRDKDISVGLNEEIVFSESYVGCRLRGGNYLSWGLNINGCAFVSAAVNSPEWTKLLYQGQIDKADRLYKKETVDLSLPTIFISQLLPTVQSRHDWLSHIVRAKEQYRSYNIILADRFGATKIEVYKDKLTTSEIQGTCVSTNHFSKINFGPRKQGDYPSSFRRQFYVNKLIAENADLEFVMKVLKPKLKSDQSMIWRNGVFSTRSSTILDMKNNRVYFARSPNEDYLTLGLERT